MSSEYGGTTNNNNNSNNPNNNNHGVVNRPVTKLSFGAAFVTQWDFDGPSIQEAWYGHHSPLGRTMVCLLLGTMIHTVQFLFTMKMTTTTTTEEDHSIPILQYLSPQELQEMKQSHSDCWNTICNVLETDVNFNCIVKDELGEVAYLDYDNYNGLYHVPFPSTCIEAIHKTVGNIDIPDFDMLHIDQVVSKQEDDPTPIQKKNGEEGVVDGDDVDRQEKWSGMTVHSDCTISIPLGGNNEQQHVPSLLQQPPPPNQKTNHNLVPLLRRNFPNEKYTPGQTVSSVLHEIVCVLPTQLPPGKEDGDPPIVLVQQLYEFLFDCRHIIALVGSIVIYSFAVGMDTLLAMGRLLVVTIALRYLLPWPKDVIEYQKVGFWSTWSTLVVLYTFVNGYHRSNIVSLVVDAMLCYMAYSKYNNRQVTMELVFVMILRKCTVGWDIVEFMKPFDILNLLSYILYWIPGATGEGKILMIYAFLRSYPMLKWNKTTTTTSGTTVTPAAGTSTDPLIANDGDGTSIQSPNIATMDTATTTDVNVDEEFIRHTKYE